MSVKVKVEKKTITAIVDSGANINYVNKNWCDTLGLPYKMVGWGWVKSYKGEKTPALPIPQPLLSLGIGWVGLTSVEGWDKEG